MKYNVNDVFTPSSPAKVNFIERKEINKRITRALSTKGKQIVVYGHSGSGKTTLLEKKLKSVYPRHIKTNCMKGMNFENVLLDAFDQLSVFYEDEKSQSVKSGIKTSILTNFQIIKAQLVANRDDIENSKQKRLLPPQLTGPNLAKMLGELGICWVLEDFHKINDEDKVELSQLMKVFMDHSDTYPDLKIIAVGAVNTARQVVQYDSEMRRRVSEIKVPLMNEAEIHKIIEQGVKLLNISFEKYILDDVWEHSNGVASICHQLCQLMCESKGLFQTNVDEDPKDWVLDIEDMRYAQREYLEIESDTIKRAFDKAFKVKCSHEVLYVLTRLDTSGVAISEIFEKSKYHEFSVTDKQLETALKDLCTEEYGELLKFDEDSHKYSFSDPFYKTFAQFLIKESEEENHTRKRMSDSERQRLLNQAFNSLVGTYQASSIPTGIRAGKSDFTGDDELVGDDDPTVAIGLKELKKTKANASK